MQNRKIPTDQQMEEIISAREQDILIRGKDCPVYNYCGKIVELGAAKIWYDENGHYVKPRTSQDFECIIS
tara:strand:- start:489 stop:698 length:210 start_codon:yes stop_codon:yes gene_type:complete